MSYSTLYRPDIDESTRMYVLWCVAGSDEVDFSLKHKLRDISKGVGKTITSFRKTVVKRKPSKKR